MDFQIEPLSKPSKYEYSVPADFLSRYKKPLFMGIGVLIIISFIVFLMGRGSFKENSLELKIDGPPEASSGDLVTYKIKYRNNNSISLKNVNLNLFYPSDSIIIRENETVKLTNESFDIGNLDGKESGEKEITLYIVGDRGNIKNIKANLNYRAENLSSVFKKEVSFNTNITNIPIPLTLVATPTVINGQKTTYLLDYRNQSNEDFQNLRLTIEYPSGFSPNKYTPKPSITSGKISTWEIKSLKSGESGRISVEGIINGNERESKPVYVILQRQTETATGNIYIDFEKAESSSVISSPILALNFTVNDSIDYTAHLADTLRYKLKFTNNSQENLGNFNLSLKLDGSMYDLTTVKSSGFFDSRENTIFWNPSVIPALNLLQSGQSGTAEFEVRLKNSFSSGLGAKDSFVKAIAHIETTSVPASLDLDKLVADNELITRISTAPIFSQKILINDAVFGSKGPYPPKVDQETYFAILWNLINPANDVSHAKITATLAPGVKWVNQVRVKGTQITPSYDSRLNSVTWDLGNLPAGTGVGFDPYELSFQISITPSVNQVNQQPALIKNVRFEGVDTFTQEKITRTIFDTTTSNVNDSNAGGTVQN